MKRLWMAAVAALATVVTAQEVTILGTLRNKDKGQIVFTLIKSDCKDGQHLVYTTSGGGEIGIFGCFAYVNGQMFVSWNDGTMYSYPIDEFEFSVDAERMLRQRK
jgi:hypothetical protein